MLFPSLQLFYRNKRIRLKYGKAIMETSKILEKTSNTSEIYVLLFCSLSFHCYPY